MDPNESEVNERIDLKEVLEKTDFNAIPKLESLIGREAASGDMGFYNQSVPYFNLGQQTDLSLFVNQMNNSLNVQPEQNIPQLLQSQYYNFIMQQMSMNVKNAPNVSNSFLPNFAEAQALPNQGNPFGAKVVVSTPYAVPMPQNVLGWKEFYEDVKASNKAEFKSEAAFLNHVNKLWDTLERYERQYYIESSLLAGKSVNFVLQRFKCANYECTLLARTFADRGKFYCSDACLIQDVKRSFCDMFNDKKKIAPMVNINCKNTDDKGSRKRHANVK